MKLRVTKSTVAFGVVGAMLLAATALAATIKYTAKTSVYNPGNHAITNASKWVDGAGEPGGSDKQGVVLVLSYTDIYPPGTSSDLTVDKMCTATDPVTHNCTAGTSLTSLGYDRLKSGYCTNGSPRWDIETLDGGVYFIGCTDGTHTDQSGFQAGWERIAFSNADWEYASGPTSGCDFTNNTGGCSVVFLQLLDDEGPAVAVVDNVLVNSQVIGKG